MSVPLTLESFSSLHDCYNLHVADGENHPPVLGKQTVCRARFNKDIKSFLAVSAHLGFM